MCYSAHCTNATGSRKTNGKLSIIQKTNHSSNIRVPVRRTSRSSPFLKMECDGQRPSGLQLRHLFSKNDFCGCLQHFLSVLFSEIAVCVKILTVNTKETSPFDASDRDDYSVTNGETTSSLFFARPSKSITPTVMFT